MDAHPSRYVWAWFKPESAPDTLCVQLPDEAFDLPGAPGPLTLKNVLSALDVAADEIAGWAPFGRPYEAIEWNSALEAPLAPPSAGIDPIITLFLNVPEQPAGGASESSVAIPSNVSNAAREGSAEGAALTEFEAAHPGTIAALARMEIEWTTIVQLENSLFSLRQQFSGMLMRLNALNRELTADEARAADQVDRRDWQTARTWMRDVITRLMRAIKEFDQSRLHIGDKRRWLESAYFQYVMPRRPFEGLEQTEQEFQMLRGMLQTLYASLCAVRDPGWQEAERKLHHTLNRIAFKMRADRTRR